MALKWQVRRGASRTVLGAALGVAASCVVATGPAQAKLPGMVHCYNDICHRVRTVAETEARLGTIEPVVASRVGWHAYDPLHDAWRALRAPVTRGAAIVRINNAGPYYPGRTLDVSRGVAERLGFTSGGVMQLLTVVIAAPSESDARYARGRVYPKVAGYLGTFDNLALANPNAVRLPKFASGFCRTNWMTPSCHFRAISSRYGSSSSKRVR